MTVVEGIFGRTAQLHIDETHKMLHLTVKRKLYHFPFSALKSVEYHSDGRFGRAKQWQMPIALAVLFGLLGSLSNSLGGMLLAAAGGAYIGQQLARSTLFEHVEKAVLTLYMEGETPGAFKLIFFDLKEAENWEEMLREVL